MGKRFNLGFVGGGLSSAVGTTHFVSSQMDGRFQVVAGCFSCRHDVNTQTAERWHIPPERRYDHFQDLLKHEVDCLDAIVVLTPTPDHSELVIQALKQGYPVICEKAIAASSDEAQSIKKVQAEHNGFLAVTYNYTGYPMLRELKYLIQQGKLGLIEQVHVEMPQEGFARLNREGKPVIPQKWRLHDAKLPTLSLDLGVHVHNILYFLTREKPLELVAMQSSKGRFRQVVDNTMCIARYTNNLECNIWFSKSALGYRNGLRVRVFGEEGSVEWYQMEPEFLTYHDNQGHQMIIDRASVDVGVAHLPRYNRFKSGHPDGFLEAFANLYWDIANELESFCNQNHQLESDYTFTVQHALEGLVMLEAIENSSRNRRWESLGSQA